MKEEANVFGRPILVRLAIARRVEQRVLRVLEEELGESKLMIDYGGPSSIIAGAVKALRDWVQSPQMPPVLATWSTASGLLLHELVGLSDITPEEVASAARKREAIATGDATGGSQ